MSKWNGGFDLEDYASYVRYDYVEYWEYVPESEWASTTIANEYHPFKLAWKDDFNSLDESRWEKTNDSSFGENDATFMAS